MGSDQVNELATEQGLFFLSNVQATTDWGVHEQHVKNHLGLNEVETM